jgi:carboxylate-amine ligase
MSLTVEETSFCFQAVVAKLYKLNQQNVSFNIYRLALIKENKFRASRYIDFNFKRSGDQGLDSRIT